jgi:hypothetical protein
VLTSIAMKPPCTCGHLAQRPAHEASVLVAGNGADMDDVAHVEVVGERAARPVQIAVLDRAGLVHALDPQRRGAAVDRQNHRGMPAAVQRHVARHAQLRARRAPGLFALQILVRQTLARAAPAAEAAVVLLERALQRMRGADLQFGMDGGANAQPAGEEFGLAKARRELAPDLVGEIVAVGQGLAEGENVARLDGQERLRARPSRPPAG